MFIERQGATNSEKSWKPEVHKVRSRLSSWNRRNMSFGGTIVLNKAVLLSLPLYYMSIFNMLDCVIKSIESIQARFLWGWFNLKKKIHLVAWSRLSNSKLCGGLGDKKYQTHEWVPIDEVVVEILHGKICLLEESLKCKVQNWGERLDS